MSALAVLRAQKAILQAGKLAFRAAGIVFYIRGSAATEEALLLRSHAISLRFSFLCAVRHSCYILSSRSLFVKNFFQDFFYRSDQSLSATFIEYHVSVTLSSTFLFFFIFSMICFRLSQRQLSYNSTPDSLCQLLFSIFSSFSQFYFFPVTYCIIHTKNRTFQKQNVRFA